FPGRRGKMARSRRERPADPPQGRNMRTTTTLLLAMLAATGVRADTLIHAGRLIDGASDRFFTEMTLRIDGGTIVDVEKGFAAPGPNDTVIDLSGYTVLPGLMDTHVHLDGEYSADSRLKEFVMNEAD